MSTPVEISVVVPVFEESAHLAASLAEIRRHLLTLDEPFELVVVDDGSRDGTWEVLAGVAATSPELVALGFGRNFGKEAAVRAGLEAARGQAVVVMDADLQHPPARLPAMVEAWRAGAEVVSTVKPRRGREGWLVRLGAGVFYRAFDLLSGFDLAGASDFKLLDRKVVEALLGLEERGAFFRGLVPWFGFREVRLEVEVPDRAAGASRWSLARLAALAIRALTSFTTLPLQLVTVLGVLFMAFSLPLGAQTLYNWWSGSALDGFTTVILLQLIIGGSLMLSLGVLGQYVARIFEEVKRRPRYVVTRRLGAGCDAASTPGAGE